MLAHTCDVMPKLPATSAFAGFRPAGLGFLRDLAKHQDRTWFQDHKSTFESEVRDPMAALVIALSEALAKRRLPLWGDPKGSVFRLNRDIRFSADKRPYKTHTSAVLTRDGSKMSQGLLYVHIDPAGSFAAAGAWQPQPAHLQAIRQRIVAKNDISERAQSARSSGAHPRTRRERAQASSAWLRRRRRLRNSAKRSGTARSSSARRCPRHHSDAHHSSATSPISHKRASPLLRFIWSAIDTID